MPKTCARCGSLAGRGRELPVPGDWLSYLRSERDLSATVGRLAMPLCADCAGDVESLLDADPDGSAEAEAFLDELALDALIDEGA